jgi:hypothetical protein
LVYGHSHDSPLIDTGNYLLIIVAITGGLSFFAMQCGLQTAIYNALFSTQVRYSGASRGYQIGAILDAAFAQSIAVLLRQEFGIINVSM